MHLSLIAPAVIGAAIADLDPRYVAALIAFRVLPVLPGEDPAAIAALPIRRPTGATLPILAGR